MSNGKRAKGARRTAPDLQELRRRLYYDPDTGNFIWSEANPKNLVGKIAGCKNRRGYILIGFNYELYMAHVLAWFYMTGTWREGDVDHIDRGKSNNKWKNLREATRTQNNANAKIRSDNTSGVRGVHFNKGAKKWQASINHNKRHFHLGLFKTKEEAATAYRRKSVELFGEFHRDAA